MGSNLPQVVATDFFWKINSPHAGRNSSDSAWSLLFCSLIDPLPDCSNYSSFCHTHYLTLQSDQYFTSLYGPDYLPRRSLLQCFTAESSREIMSSEECHSALRNLNNKQRQVVMFLLLLFKLSSQFLFVSFLYIYPLSAPLISLFSLSSFPLASPPSLLSLLIHFLSS